MTRYRVKTGSWKLNTGYWAKTWQWKFKTGYWVKTRYWKLKTGYWVIKLGIGNFKLVTGLKPSI